MAAGWCWVQNNCQSFWLGVRFGFQEREGHAAAASNSFKRLSQVCWCDWRRRRRWLCLVVKVVIVYDNGDESPQRFNRGREPARFWTLCFCWYFFFFFFNFFCMGSRWILFIFLFDYMIEQKNCCLENVGMSCVCVWFKSVFSSFLLLLFFLYIKFIYMYVHVNFFNERIFYE